MASAVVSDPKARQKRELQERYAGYADFEAALWDFVDEYVPEGAVPYAAYLFAAHALIPVYPDSAPPSGIAANKGLGLLRISLNEARARRRSGGRQEEASYLAPAVSAPQVPAKASGRAPRAQQAQTARFMELAARLTPLRGITPKAKSGAEGLELALAVPVRRELRYQDSPGEKNFGKSLRDLGRFLDRVHNFYRGEWLAARFMPA